MKQIDRSQEVIDSLLQLVKRRFYFKRGDKIFYRDRRFLMKCLTWPALWMDQRGVGMTSQRYEKLLSERINDIADNGNHQARPYFPKYFLYCLQDHFAHHGEKLYYELKEGRNIFDLSFQNLDKVKIRKEDKTVNILAEAHKLWTPAKPRKRSGKPPADNQPELF